MSKLVVVSNRLPTMQPAAQGYAEPDVPAGGLVRALLGFLSKAPGSLWFGWNGRVHPEAQSQRPSRRTVRGVDLMGFPLTPAEVEDYYLGFCNGTLWPLLHCFQGKVRIRLQQERRYREVQIRMAAALRPFLGPGDLVWVHDYHLLLLGRALRHLGWKGRLGFFFHTPFPPHDLWQLLPRPREMLDAMLDYDVVGFHVRGFLDNYIYACSRELGTAWDGTWLTAGHRVQRPGVYPVGIDPDDFARPPGAGRAARRMRPGVTRRPPRLVLGVDRLDYTKGIPERILAFNSFLDRYAHWQRKVVYVQIASPSRTDVPEYMRQKRRVDALVGRVNGEFGAPSWTPIQYLYRTYSQSVLSRLYRRADVCLVTPLRDGMNLVAKEFIAAQDPESPGVLVLSRCAGAAQELREAVIVNPYVPSDVADGIAAALEMPLAERRERHTALLGRVRTTTASSWGERFVADLARAGASARQDRKPASMEPLALLGRST